MKNGFGALAIAAVVAGISIVSDAASEKKNMPKPQDVLIELKKIGTPHFEDKMKVYKIGTIEAGANFYHIFRAQMKDSSYRVVVYDNTPAYVGFYACDLEPSELEESSILFDSDETSEEGDPIYFRLTIPSSGPSARATIGSFPTTLVRVSDAKKPAETTVAATPVTSTPGVPAATPAESNEPQYREWTITVKGKEVKVRALYISQDFGKVTIKSEATGANATLMLIDLSPADQEYVKKMK